MLVVVSISSRDVLFECSSIYLKMYSCDDVILFVYFSIACLAGVADHVPIYSGESHIRIYLVFVIVSFSFGCIPFSCFISRLGPTSPLFSLKKKTSFS